MCFFFSISKKEHILRERKNGYGMTLGVDKPPAHFLPKEELKMIDFRIPYWLGQWDLSFNQKP